MDQKEFARRRKQLMRMMGSDSIAILPTNIEQPRNRDVEFPFRPHSDFVYLTGFPEPEAVLVLLPGRKHGEFILFCRDRDKKMEIWNGRRAGPEGAIEKYGADDAFPIADMDDILPGLLENRERVFYTMGAAPAFDPRVIGWLNQLRGQSRTGQRPPEEFVSLEHLVHDMRLYKSREEIKVMRRAAKIASDAHKRAMRECTPGMIEYELEAAFLHEFRKEGGEPAYSSIVGGGANGCILHYTENNMPLNDGELVLIDAGMEHQYYASDITRTFPVNGIFSKEQRLIYQLVLDAQHAAIEAVYPGNSWNAPHLAAVKVLTKGLVKLGLLKGKTAQLIKDNAYAKFYMHRTGHWLGLDVHDVGDYKVGEEWRVLEVGMVLTVEPGLYIAKSRSVPRKWWNIGVRIEDDVLVTRHGHDVLSKHAPKEVDDIEALMALDCAG